VRIEPAPASLPRLDKIALALKGEFPVQLPLRQVQLELLGDFGSDRPTSVSDEKQTMGWRLTHKNKQRVVQLRTNGFTYSHLPPYSDWVTFSQEAESLWDTYAGAIGMTSSHRVGVRVINRLPDAVANAPLNDYLNLFPNIPESLPSDEGSFMMRLQLPMKHVDDAAQMLLGLYPGRGPTGDTKLMLDIDVFIDRPIPRVDTFALINRLGAVKDDVFEACITDKIRDIIA
jgi:uncharacterized protein (TIGR04255 family)